MRAARTLFAGLVWAFAALYASAQVNYVPLEFRTVEGIRPFVSVQLNGTPFVFMVHGNASFYVMTTHANAAKAGVTDTRHDANFGIDAPGHVSSAGLTRTTLKSLKVGDQEDHDVPFSLFEVPVAGMDGMLGIGWLRANNVIVDYDGLRLGLAKTPEDGHKEDARLVHDGFVAHAMTWDPDLKRFVVSVEVNGKRSRMVVSTVSSDIVDVRFARTAGIALGPVVYVDSGPRGARVDNWLSKRPVRLSIDGQKTAWMQPTVQDTYAYSSGTPPADETKWVGGYLGCDFMLANDAVIDFGTGTLLLRPPVE
ncbi:MAG: aspartyl protease family protein [Candidatus Korobacteraceae bacterium]